MRKEVHEKRCRSSRSWKAMPPMSAESTVSRNYLDWLLAVPWKKRSKESPQHQAGRRDAEPGPLRMEKIKDRILEFLAVRQLVKNPRVRSCASWDLRALAKTSLGMSIAKATGRKFVRMSLGGVRDEAEIRGHGPYIGGCRPAHPDKMKKAEQKSVSCSTRLTNVHGLPRRSVGGEARSA